MGVKDDQRSKVKEEGLQFSRGPGNVISSKLMRDRLEKHMLQKQLPLCN